MSDDKKTDKPTKNKIDDKPPPETAPAAQPAAAAQVLRPYKLTSSISGVGTAGEVVRLSPDDPVTKYAKLISATPPS